MDDKYEELRATAAKRGYYKGIAWELAAGSLFSKVLRPPKAAA